MDLRTYLSDKYARQPNSASAEMNPEVPDAAQGSDSTEPS
jgi:hypothetical protein